MTEKIKKIILVEDDPAIREVYTLMIKKAKFEVEALSSGQEALTMIQQFQAGEASKPDIILLDLILPDMNGMDILAQIRKNPATKDIKVFILTNQDKAEANQVGDVKPDKFIIKANTTPTQLIELIKNEL